MTNRMGAKAVAFAVTLVAGLAAIDQAAAAPAQSGKASWYALHSRTACGPKMNPNAMIAAHRTLPCGTKVRVTNSGNGRSVIVTIIDRGPFIRGRIVDVSRAAAQQLGFLHAGVANVTVARLGAVAEAEPVDLNRIAAQPAAIEPVASAAEEPVVVASNDTASPYATLMAPPVSRD